MQITQAISQSNLFQFFVAPSFLLLLQCFTFSSFMFRSIHISK